MIVKYDTSTKSGSSNILLWILGIAALGFGYYKLVYEPKQKAKKAAEEAAAAKPQ